jgi:hypothetical protein
MVSAIFLDSDEFEPNLNVAAERGAVIAPLREKVHPFALRRRGRA